MLANLTVSVEEAGRAFGVSRGTAYRLVREGKFPVPVIRVGRRLVVPVADIESILGPLDGWAAETERVLGKVTAQV